MEEPTAVARGLQPARASAFHADAEIDPTAYVLDGFSIYVGLGWKRWRFDLGNYGMALPRFAHGNSDYDVSFAGFGAKVQYFLFAERAGPFVGVDGGANRLLLQRRGTDLAARQSVEARQFESRETYEASLAIALRTAVRILALVKQAQLSPKTQATITLSDEEEHVLVEHAKRKRALAPDAPDALRLDDAVELIAKLGGYKARSCDGPPGWITLWRGLRRLEAMVEGYRLATGVTT